MTRLMSSIVLGIGCFVVGAAVQRTYDARNPIGSQSAGTAQTAKSLSQSATAGSVGAAPAPPWVVDPFDRSKIDFAKQPLWAWGETEPPKPDDKQAVQGAPGAPRANANANLSPEEVQRKRHVDGSKIEMSLLEIRTPAAAAGGGNVIDWFPDEHPNPVPDIIKHGPASLGKDTRACGTCHLSDGSGRPENASPAGLPAAYIVRQLKDFRDGLRHNADQRKANSNTMVLLARAMSEDEMQQAADYWAAVKWRPHVKVVETRLVPKTKIQGELFIPTAKERTEPIGKRIIESPEDVEQSQVLRSSHGTWIAYVPVGSIKKGKNLVETGGMTVVNGQIVAGKTLACGTCHGKDLKGIAPDVPGLAGRSPSYMAREIFDIQQRARVGSNSNVELMRVAIKDLTPEDILDITAYLASLPVESAPANQVAER
jgi:cytochrome c553